MCDEALGFTRISALLGEMKPRKPLCYVRFLMDFRSTQPTAVWDYCREPDGNLYRTRFEDGIPQLRKPYIGEPLALKETCDQVNFVLDNN